MIKEIQGLRAIAILMVLFVHSTAIFPIDYHEVILNTQKYFFTSSGVELFFVLAGYFLICSLDKWKNKYKDEGQVVQNAIHFMFYKFKRLAPNVYFWSSLVFIFSIISNNSDIFYGLNLEFKKYISTILFLRNFLETSNVSWFGVFWAVSLEFQVFLIFSFSYFLFQRKYLLYISIFLCVLMSFYRFGGSGFWLFRFDSILYGIVLYEAMQRLDKEKIKEIFKQKPASRFIISISLILCLSSVLTSFSEYPNLGVSVSATIATLMVFLALTNNGYFYVNYPFVGRVIDWLASRSYSIFCCHIFCSFLIKEIYMYMGINEGISSVFLVFISIAVLSELSYRYVENISSK